MRINRIISLLACAIATGPCFAGNLEISARASDADQLSVIRAEAIVIADAPLMEGMPADAERTPAAPVEHASVDGIGTPVDAGELDSLRGGESTVDNDVLIDGTVEGNTADHIVSGANVISDGSFANGNGINTVIQNTGSNVLIQNGMVVNVQFVAPPP